MSAETPLPFPIDGTVGEKRKWAHSAFGRRFPDETVATAKKLDPGMNEAEFVRSVVGAQGTPLDAYYLDATACNLTTIVWAFPHEDDSVQTGILEERTADAAQFYARHPDPEGAANYLAGCREARVAQPHLSWTPHEWRIMQWVKEVTGSWSTAARSIDDNDPSMVLNMIDVARRTGSPEKIEDTLRHEDMWGESLMHYLSDALDDDLTGETAPLPLPLRAPTSCNGYQVHFPASTLELAHLTTLHGSEAGYRALNYGERMRAGEAVVLSVYQKELADGYTGVYAGDGITLLQYTETQRSPTPQEGVALREVKARTVWAHDTMESYVARHQAHLSALHHPVCAVMERHVGAPLDHAAVLAHLAPACEEANGLLAQVAVYDEWVASCEAEVPQHEDDERLIDAILARTHRALYGEDRPLPDSRKELLKAVAGPHDFQQERCLVGIKAQVAAHKEPNLNPVITTKEHTR